jgi:hypothetical protein
MDDIDRAKARVVAETDESWAVAESRLADIERIARDGPDGGERDGKLVAFAVALVLAELHYRRCLRIKPD